ncbi:MAG: 2'-5' RNA ligase [Chloroflexi bacterium RBG_16_48_8]|nr:MAG: 2'-5' RNA ligase [Chloroflexi bacterium RBG_16_48_8]
MRLFIAIDLSSTLREHLSAQIDQLSRSLGSENIRWMKASGIHLTLKFLGETPENQIVRIGRTLKDITPQFSSFKMRIGNFGCFPNLSRPRVLWIGVHEQTGTLEQLSRILESELAKLGFKKEGRPFNPHLTLGRIRKGIRSSELTRLSRGLETIQINELGTEMLKEICLFSSTLRPSGAEYTKLAAFNFGDSE